MNYFHQLIMRRRQQALQWPLQQTQPVDPVQPGEQGAPPPPPKPGEIPKPGGDNMAQIADKILAEGFTDGGDTQVGTPSSLQSPELGQNPVTSGGLGGLQSSLNQQRKQKALTEPSPLGGSY